MLQNLQRKRLNSFALILPSRFGKSSPTGVT